ncbi:hypothetical protein GCM10009848_45190 [Micromonospora lupini]
MQLHGPATVGRDLTAVLEGGDRVEETRLAPRFGAPLRLARGDDGIFSPSCAPFG